MQKTSSRIIVVVPAFRAVRTLHRVVDEISADIADEIIMIDDASGDGTAELGRELGLTVVEHDRNRGYGGSQKTGYSLALQRGADVVVMIHGDYQYDARMIRPAVDVIRSGVCDVILGNRIRTRREALDNGMPFVKYLANRGLTVLQNVLAGQNLGEWHSGFRAYSRDVLETIPFQRNSDDFLFDSQVLLQCVHFGFRVGDLPVPVRYFDEASSIRFGPAARYAGLTMWTLARWFLHRSHIWRCSLFEEDGLPE